MAVLIRISLCFSLFLCRIPPLSAGTEAPPSQTFEDWVVLDVDHVTYFARRSDFDATFEASKNGEARAVQRIPLYSFSFDNPVPGGAPAVVQATASKPQLELKIYPKGPAGVPMAACPPDDACDGSGKATDQPARVCDDGELGTCGGGLGARWKRDQPLSVAEIDPKFNLRVPVFGSEDRSLARLPARERWLMKVMRRKAEEGGDPGAYREILRGWSETGRFDEHGRLKSYFDPDSGHLGGALKAQFKLRNSGEGAAARPDLLGSLSPLEREYLETMLPPDLRAKMLAVARDPKLSAQQATQLAGYLREATRGELSGKTVPAKDQLEFLTKNFAGLGAAADDALKAGGNPFDGESRRDGSLNRDGSGNLIVNHGDDKGKDDPTGLPASEFRPKVPKIDQGRVSEIIPEKKLGEEQKPASGFAQKALGFAKNKWMMGGLGAALGGVLGFMMLGPIGAAMGVMAGGVMGALGSQIAVNMTGPPGES